MTRKTSHHPNGRSARNTKIKGPLPPRNQNKLRQKQAWGKKKNQRNQKKRN